MLRPALVEVGGGATSVTPVGDPAALAAALDRVIADAAFRGSLEDAGRRRAEHYSWTATADRMWRLYDQL